MDPEEQFDTVVSVEMIEAVAWQDQDVYLEALARHTDPELGRIALQSINIDPKAYPKQRHSVTSTNTAIFPGGRLTPADHIAKKMTQNGWRRQEQTELGPDYSLTLREWRRNNLDNREALTRQWLDEGVSPDAIKRYFIGFSGLYLGLSEAGFRPDVQNITASQMLLVPQAA